MSPLSKLTAEELSAAVVALHEGRVIAYPTEAVFGLGCDPFNQTAVLHICELKKRNPAKGLILIASEWSHITPLIATIPEQRR